MSCGQRVVIGPAEAVVAMTSMPVLSRPKKMSRPSIARLGITAPPMGTLPAGTMVRNIGGPGRGAGRLTAELSHVLRMARVVEELPPESKANEPVEEKTIEAAGAGRAMGGCKACRAE